MKRIIALVLILTLSLFCFAACKKNKNNDENNDNNTPVENDYKLAIGVALSQDGAKVSNTVAALVLDNNSKIVACRIDAIDVEAALVAGKVDANKTYSSKAVLCKDGEYGMLTNSPYYGSSLAEWDAQAKAFETYVTGKTQAEVNAIATNEEGKPTSADLTAGCTIAVTDFIKAVDNAFKSEKQVSFKSASALTLGVAVNADVAQEEETEVASYTADFAATVFADGKVVAAIVDANQADSTIAGEEFGAVEYKGTKLAQGDAYGMLTNSPYYGSSLAEWYSQAQAFANTAVGKTAAELAGLAIEGVAGCTMYAGGYKAALELAASFAR